MQSFSVHMDLVVLTQPFLENADIYKVEQVQNMYK